MTKHEQRRGDIISKALEHHPAGIHCPIFDEYDEDGYFVTTTLSGTYDKREGCGYKYESTPNVDKIKKHLKITLINKCVDSDDETTPTNMKLNVTAKLVDYILCLNISGIYDNMFTAIQVIDCDINDELADALYNGEVDEITFTVNVEINKLENNIVWS